MRRPYEGGIGYCPVPALPYLPWNLGARFSKKAFTASR